MMTLKLLNEPGVILSVVFVSLATLITMTFGEPVQPAAQVKSAATKAAQSVHGDTRAAGRSLARRL